METYVIKLQEDEPDFSFTEAINMLRENVQMAGYQCKILSVTSALPNEGKSHISFYLAKSLANLGKLTLLIDCDMRNSVFKQEHGITEKTVGLSEYLCGQCKIDDLLYETSVENFDFVFSGKKPPNPSELLSGDRFERMLVSLKETYDYIILDAPPVNLVVDASIVSKKADNTILVVKSGSTDRSTALQMKKQMEMSGVKILGVVMNLHEVHKKSYGKYGYGYGKYGYGYGKYGYGYGKYGYGKEEKTSFLKKWFRKSSHKSRKEK